MEKKVYDAEYHKRNIKGIYIPFNRNNADDNELLNYIRSKGKGNGTGYIKCLIADDMRKDAEYQKRRALENRVPYYVGC